MVNQLGENNKQIVNKNRKWLFSQNTKANHHQALIIVPFKIPF
jgi:hypothetical protein